jgi:succinate dehydrogenase / fumarate reductase membrane anchor subunit
MSAARMRSPLGRAIGLGSAKAGVEHWWMQRLTSLALVPLCLWFVISVIAHLGADYGEFVEWVASPLVSVTFILLIVAGFYHAALGAQVVIEDYVHHEGARLASIVIVRLAAVALGVAAVFAVLRLAFGSPF